MTNLQTRHRPDRGNRSIRLDPYAIDDDTMTLEEWRRWEMPVRQRPLRTRPADRRRKER